MTMPPYVLIFLQGFTIAITSLGLLFNSLIVYGIHKTKKSRSIADYALNLNLSISDLLLCCTWLTITIFTMARQSTLFELDNVCKIEGLILYTFLGSSVFTLLSIATFHYSTVVLEQVLTSRTKICLVIVLIWSLALFGSLFGGGMFTGDSFVSQPSGLYCLNDFTETLLIERAFNMGIVLILTISPLFFLLIYYRIWKKLELHRHQLFVRRHQQGLGGSTVQKLNVNKMIIRRAIAVASTFAFVFYFDAGLFTYQIITGNKIPWVYDAAGACLGVSITVVNPLLFFCLDLRARKAILRLFVPGENDKAKAIYSVSVDSVASS